MQANWLGLDISRYVVDDPAATVEISDDKLVDRQTKIKLLSRGGAWSPDLAGSMLSGVDWEDTQITITGDNATYSGVVTGLATKQGITTLTTQSLLHPYLESEVDYYQTFTDPATALLGVLHACGVPDELIDTQSIGGAAAWYPLHGVLISAIFSKENNLKLLDAINKLAMLGSMSIWVDSKLHVSLPVAKQADYELSASELMNYPEVTPGQGQMHKHYSVNYLFDGDVPASDDTGIASGQNRAKDVWQGRYDETSPVKIEHAAGAHALGQLKVARDNKQKRTVKSRIQLSKKPLEMGAIYRLTLPDTGTALYRLTGKRARYGVADITLQEANYVR